MTRYISFRPPESLNVVSERLRLREKEIENGKLLFIAVLLEATGEFLGCFSLEDLDKRTPEMSGWLIEENI